MYRVYRLSERIKVQDQPSVDQPNLHNGNHIIHQKTSYMNYEGTFIDSVILTSREIII